MSVPAALIKLLGCTSVAFGITFFPLNFGVKEGENKQVEPVIFQKESSVSIGSSSNGKTIGIKNIDKLLKLEKGSKQSLSFKELGIKWGDEELSEGDILTSPEQNGKYYLAKPYRGGYILGNGKVSYTLNKWERIWDNLDYVNLNWKSRWIGSITLSTIALGSCNFNRIDDSRFNVVCFDNFWGGKPSGEKVYGILNLKEN